MSRKKKIIGVSLIAVLILTLIAYVAANIVLDRVSRRLMTDLATKAENRGIGVGNPIFESARFSFLLAPTWSDFRARVSSNPNGRGTEWDLHLERVILDWGFNNHASFVADGVTLVDASDERDDRDVSNRQIVLDRLSWQIPFDLLHPRAAIPALLEEAERLSTEGSTDWPLAIEGAIVCNVKHKPVELQLQVDERDGRSSLSLETDDLAELSPLFEKSLTDAEVELIAIHPLRAARLLQIKETAESRSSRARQKDPSVPEDAYRHILWSYLLAQAFDAEFAEEVGNAHESGNTGNTEAEREMDLHNNAIGRKYAELGIKQSEVLQQLMNDPEVRRTP